MLVNGFVYLHYDLSVLRQNNVLQRVLHQQGEVHLIHGHVRKRRLLQRDREKETLEIFLFMILSLLKCYQIIH